VLLLVLAPLAPALLPAQALLLVLVQQVQPQQALQPAPPLPVSRPLHSLLALPLQASWLRWPATTAPAPTLRLRTTNMRWVVHLRTTFSIQDSKQSM
jgi:hypothetical protein